jgi:glycosyltransferase involved in cell wall biosynthesis
MAGEEETTMRQIVRLLVGLIGAASLLAALTFWLNMEALLKGFGIEPVGLVGRATVRADMAGLFLTIAVMALMAAWKRSRMWALGALVPIIAAIAGRLVGVMIDGTAPEIWPPIMIEAFGIAVLLWARSVWRAPA